MAGYRKPLPEKFFNGNEKVQRAFYRVLFAVDIISILFFITHPFLESNSAILAWMEVGFGVVLLEEYVAQVWVADKKLGYIFHRRSIVDIIVILALLIPPFTAASPLMRVIRSLRILQVYRAASHLSFLSNWVYERKNIIQSFLHLFTYLFIVSTFVFVVQSPINPTIKNYLDALYYTVSTLTTVGYGDVTLVGKSGRVLSIGMMIFGISLFVRLGQSILAEMKRMRACPNCGYTKHDLDALHCKKCGTLLPKRIAREGGE
ncbi:MAG: ion transporter [Candidatus Gracilibacteria bacterium]|jgi:voltage-gated potassium channel